MPAPLSLFKVFLGVGNAVLTIGGLVPRGAGAIHNTQENEIRGLDMKVLAWAVIALFVFAVGALIFIKWLDDPGAVKQVGWVVGTIALGVATTWAVIELLKPGGLPPG